MWRRKADDKVGVLLMVKKATKVAVSGLLLLLVISFSNAGGAQMHFYFILLSPRYFYGHLLDEQWRRLHLFLELLLPWLSNGVCVCVCAEVM